LFSESELNRVRSAVDIVDLIGEYVSLKKAGQGYVGLCPFHNEKSGSFHVHPAKQIFHCFGCQKGGNVFSFVSAVEGLNFPETVKKLAKRVGIELEETRTQYVRKEAPPPQNERTKAALEWAAKFFHYLLTEVPEYRWARDYVHKRGLTDQSIERFRIGMAPKGWNTLMDHMLKRKFTMEELVEAGLVVPKDTSPRKGYDRFRERLMFPIRDIEGSVIGFGARLMKDEPNQPKYINSSDSPLFSKRKTLFGLYESQRAIRVRGEAIIVEGYMDVIGLNERGVNNAVATMGTALTEEHCTLLKGITQRVVTVFDPDAGGQEAWRRSVHLFLSYGLFAKDLSLPANTDPDEYIQQEGAEKFYAACERAPRQITKLLREIAGQGPLSEEETGKWLQELTPILVASRRLPDRALIWDNISLVLKVSMDALRELSEGTGGNAARTVVANAAASDAQAKTDARNARPPIKPGNRREKPLVDPLEMEFFRAALRAPQAFKALDRTIWEPALKYPRIRHWLVRLSDADGGWTTLLEELAMSDEDPLLQGSATASLLPAPETGSSDAPPQVSLEILFERMRLRKKELEIKALSAQVRLTERLGDDQEGLRLLERLKDLRSS
jgi:DNA primase catalytic core